MRRGGRILIGVAALGIAAIALFALWLSKLDLPNARQFAKAEVERMCRDDGLDCSSAREIQATDSGHAWLLVYAVPDRRYSEVSAIVSKHSGMVELGRLARD